MSKNRFGKFWNFDPWRPQFWPEPKNDRNDFEMIFRELSNVAFRFYLRRPGAEIMGGGVQTPPPPPPAGGGKSRGPAGRGLKGVRLLHLSSENICHVLTRAPLGYSAERAPLGGGGTLELIGAARRARRRSKARNEKIPMRIKNFL